MQAAPFVAKICRKYRRNFDEEEIKAQAWSSLVEAYVQYPKFEGCCDWNLFAETFVKNELSKMKWAWDKRIHFESPYPFNHTQCDDGSAAEDFVCSKQSDFTKDVFFRDYLSRLNPVQQVVAKAIIYGLTSDEIIERMHFSNEDFLKVGQQLASSYKKWK